MRIFFLIAPFLFCTDLYSQYKERSLSKEQWFFRQETETKYHPAKVPGTVHTDLLRNNMIPDPFYGLNEKNLQWIGEKKWRYYTEFFISESELAHEHIDIRCKGLDTYAEVLLNGKSILHSNNMFRTWSTDIKKFAVKGKNILEVVFTPALEEIYKAKTSLPYNLPGGDYVWARKSPYHFGWDWGPRFITCGIWKDVTLIFRNEATMENVRIQTALTGDSLAKVSVYIHLNDKLKNPAKLNVNIKESKIMFSILLKPRQSDTTIECTLSNPKLWWCHGMGNPDLYHMQISLIQNKKTVQQWQEEFGIRSIQLVRDKDSMGETFYFSLNGKPVFARGANSIPLHYFLPETKPDDYESMVKEVKDAHLNMLRVWGGGTYEDEAFYRACNKNGIMVWQDFMFACGMYPGDSAFLGNVKNEISEQVIRLRNNPCIVLWCGNNEIEEGWNNWGWQKQFGYSKQDSSNIFQDYVKLFHKVIPEILKTEDDSRPYHPSSPMLGWGRKESLLQGDVHYWGVWWGMEPFENYKRKVGRFVSEFGFQSIPSYSSLQRFLPQNEMDIKSSAFKNHQKHPTGFETILQYMEREYPIPKDLRKLAYISQLLQAYGVQSAVEAHLAVKPHCMGSLFWQWNDCWPVVSWSSIDYYGNRKALYYFVKKSFDNYLITIRNKETSDQQKITLVSNDNNTFSGILKRELIDFSGTRYFQDSLPLQLKPEESKTISLRNDFAQPIDSTKMMLRYSLCANGRVLAEKKQYFCLPKNLKLKEPNIKIKKVSASKLEIEAIDYLAKDVAVSSAYFNFSDNYFDLLPGEKKIISIRKQKLPHRTKNKNRVEILSLFHAQNIL